MPTSGGGTLADPFETLEQERETAAIGTWAFLAHEVMLFGALFAVYVVYRYLYREAFLEGSERLDIPLGALATAALITSSLTMALAVRSVRLAHRSALVLGLLATMALGGAFLVIKGVEYERVYRAGLMPGSSWDPAAASPHLITFFGLYFAMTGLHALHVLLGLAILAVVTVKAMRGRRGGEDPSGIEILGLYWHLVDGIWIFLFPLLYLLAPRVPPA